MARTQAIVIKNNKLFLISLSSQHYKICEHSNSYCVNTIKYSNREIINVIITHADWLTDWMRIALSMHMQAESAGVLNFSACKGVHTLFKGQRER